MTKRPGLSAMHRSTQYTPLAALGAFLQPRDFFAPLWEHVQLGGKTIDHEPHQKLLDVVVSMLAHIPAYLVVPRCILANCLDLSVRCLHRHISFYEAC